MDLKLEILIILALVVFLIVWIFLKRNAKDKKELEQELNAKELKPDKHDDEHI
jgi:large-conductance mechanosensitive channel